MNARSTAVRATDTRNANGRDSSRDAHTSTTANTVGTATTATARARATRDADGMAVASFVLGLVGLLAMNLFLGPTAIVLAALALRRGTSRPGRARLGLALGVADLVVLACLISADHTWSWSLN